MRVRDLLGAESIELQGKAATKKEVIEQMVQLMAKRGNINDLEKYEKGVFAREEEGTTGIGEGIFLKNSKNDDLSFLSKFYHLLTIYLSYRIVFFS